MPPNRAGQGGGWPLETWCFAREEVGIVTVISGPGGGGPVDRSGSDPWEEVRAAA